MSEGLLHIDPQGRITNANPAAARLLGYTDAQLGQLSYFEINPHYSLLGWKKFWKQLATGTSRERLATEFVNADGKLFSVKGQVGYFAQEKICLVVFSSVEAGRREADLLAAVQRDGQIGSWEYNLTTGQVFVSAPIRHWLGWSPERDFYPAAEIGVLLAAQLTGAGPTLGTRDLAQLRTSAKSRELEISLQAIGGRARDYLLRAQSVENELEVYKIFGTLRPATRATATGSDTPLRFVLDQASEGVLTVNHATQEIVYANLRAAHLTAYHRPELSNLLLPHLLPAAAALLDELPEKNYLELDTEAVRQDGTLFPIRLRLHHQAGEVPQALIFLNDLQREQADDEVRQLQATTLDTVQEWVLWLDAHHRIVQLNAAARRKLSRLTSRELTGLPLPELLPDLELPSLAQVRNRQLDARSGSAVDYVYTDPGGTERTLQIRFAHVAAATRHFLGVLVQDVTADRNNKRRLQQAKRRVDELRAQLESENEALKERIETEHATGSIVTISPKYRRVLGQVGQVAGTDATVLITGETGTGKELLAQSIHDFSNRSSRPLVSVNCAALPESLIESELFGHEKGAFTGAFTQKKGKFEVANTGTIFLDEIGELPLDMQAKLLRALQEGEIQRIGSNEVIRVDVRVVAATNRNLERMIGEGTFREDLYYRLNVFPIHNLPLRERPEDIPVLVKHFTRIYADKMGRAISDISQRDLEKLAAYNFPGNVRELINLVERAVITSTTTTLNLGASLRALRRTGRPAGSLHLDEGAPLLSLDEMQRRYISEALKRSKGKVTGPGGAAEMLDVNGRTLMSRMQKLGINRNDFT
ncbi:MAG: sigma 54-interacting transcriptional regulator [Bacteroidota bacterium]